MIAGRTGGAFTAAGDGIDGVPEETGANSLAELREALDMTIDQFAGTRRVARETVSLDKPAGEEGDGSMWALIHDRNARPADETVAANLWREHLGCALDTLDEREKRALRMRYGLDDGNPGTLGEIGKQSQSSRYRTWLRSVKQRSNQ